MIKKLSFILALLLALSLFGCAAPEGEAKEEGISIVTTLFAPYDFARQVAGEFATVTMLLPPGAESHSYEPTPRDIIAIQEADLFIYAGGENESWMTEVLSTLDMENTKVISMLDVVDLLEEETVEGMEHDHEGEDHGHDSFDEHVWTSPLNAQAIVLEICDALCAIAPEYAEAFAHNAENYCIALNALHQDISRVISNAKRSTVLFGDRFPVRYFTEEYGIEYFAAFPGCSADTEASAATVAFLIDKVKEENIPVIFKVELSTGNIAEAISESTGAKVLTFTSCHNLTKDEFEAGMTYIDFMYQNLENLTEALN